MIANHLVWAIFFIVVTLGMIVLVPRDRIVKLAPFGFWAGFVLAMIIQLLAVRVFQLWQFHYLAFLSVWDIPLFIALAWGPSMIIFAHFLPLMTGAGVMAYIVGFALLSTAIEWLFVIYGYREFLNWNLLLTLALAIVLHSGLAYYLRTNKVAINSLE